VLAPFFQKAKRFLILHEVVPPFLALQSFAITSSAIVIFCEADALGNREKRQSWPGSPARRRFEIEIPNADPLAGEGWVDSVMARDFSLKSFDLRQMSVADLGDYAVVKFDRIQQATYKGQNKSGEFFVVDLWKKSGDSWKLANR
jgi:hypothetical protein